MESEKEPSQPLEVLEVLENTSNEKVEEPGVGEQSCQAGQVLPQEVASQQQEVPQQNVDLVSTEKEELVADKVETPIVAQETDSSEKATPEVVKSESNEQVSQPNAPEVNEDSSDKTVETSTPALGDITPDVNTPTTKPEEVLASDPKDHAKKTKDKSEMQGDMGTLFILDLMKQRKEKMMRKKKDDLINDLAMKKKQQMMEARMGKRVLTRPAFGGFVGVGAILAGSKNTSPMTRRRTPKPTSLEDNVDIPPPEDCELLIMGIIRDKKEQAYHEAHQVCFCSIILSPPHLKRCYFR